MKYDLIIIGAGPAGLTAGIYAARSGLKTAIVSKDIGGTANSILILENWPGFQGTGAELMKKFYEHIKKYKVDLIMEDVKEVNKKKDLFIVKTSKSELQSKSLILTAGTERKKLQIKGEAELTGRGVSYCATCDGFFFKNKTVSVIGGSDCASVSALGLSDIAKKVYVFYRGEKLRCEEITYERLKHKKNIEIIYNAIPIEILGKEKVEEIKVSVKGKSQNYQTDGIFVEIGSTPLSDFVKKLNVSLNSEGYIIVNENMNTSVKGLFAAGDITNQKLKQVIVAAAQGAIAAKSAHEYVNHL